MKVSSERLEEICSAMVTDSLYDYEQVFDSIKSGEIYGMAKELLELRKFKVTTLAEKSLEFWSSIDGKALAKVGQKEKDADLIGPKKE